MSEIIKAGGQVMGGISAKKAGQAQKKLAESNTAVIRATTKENTIRERRAGARKKGAVRNLNLSSTDVIEDLAAELELAALTSEYEGALQAQGFVNQGRIAKNRGDAAFYGSLASASGTLLSGASKAFTGGKTPTGSAGGSSLTTSTKTT